MQLIHILGAIGNIGFFTGVYLLSKKKVYGFHLNILGNLMYVGQAVIMSNYTLLVLSLGLIIINVYGIFEWRKNV